MKGNPRSFIAAGSVALKTITTLLICTLVCEAYGQLTVQKVIADDGAYNDFFGKTVAIDGDIAIIGSERDDEFGVSTGAAYIFERDESGTYVLIQKLLASDADDRDNFGWSVSVSGTTAIVGARWDEDNGLKSGSAYIFERDNEGNWIETAKLLASDGDIQDSFGRAVSISGDIAIIGSSRDDDNGAESGSVYIFKKDDSGNWNEETKLLSSDGAAGDRFGIAVGISGSTAVVSAYFDDDNATDSGSAYIFERDSSGSWAEEAKLLPDDGGITFDDFGTSVSISGDVALIGVPEDDDNDPGSGSAYVFEKDGSGEWNQTAKLLPSDGDANDKFGFSVSVFGDVMLIGAYADEANSSFSGSAYIFRRDDTGLWNEEEKLLAFDGASDDRFGWGLATDGNTFLVGAYSDNTPAGNNAGSAYFYSEVSCPNPFPALDETLLTTEFNLLSTSIQWQPIVGQNGCQVELREAISLTEVGSIIRYGAGASFVNIPFDTLAAGTDYEWRVRCGCSLNPLVAGPWSSWQAFSTPEGSNLSSLPNPTKTNSTVSFTVAESGNVTLKVFDLSGRNIATIYSGFAEARIPYQFDFDASNLPNGVYLYRLATGSEIRIEKFMVAH